MSVPQLVPGPGRLGTWQTYTTADGLAGLQIEHIAEDEAGYLWFATCTGGASRFDGDQFHTFTRRDNLSGEQVFALHADRRGRLWFGTWTGACWFQDEAFHRFPDGCVAAHRPVQFIAEDRQGWIWLGGSGLLGYWDGDRFCDLTPEPERQARYSCWGIAQDSTGDMWFGFAQLLRYDGERFYRYGTESGLGPPEPVYALACDGEGTLWVGGGQRLWRRRQADFLPAPVQPPGAVRKIQCDRQGRVWVCTQNGVLCCHGSEGTPLGVEDGLAHTVVNGFLQDREGLYWLATWGGGVSRYDADSIRLLAADRSGPNRAVAAVSRDGGAGLWVGLASEVGVGRLVDGRLVEPEHRLPTDMGPCQVLCSIGRGDLWWGGVGGLARYDGRQWQVLGARAGFSGTAVTALAEDRQGRILVGHLDRERHRLQLSRYDGQSFQLLFDRDSAEDDIYIACLLESGPGEIWFGLGGLDDSGAGLGRLGPEGATTYVGLAEGLVDNRVEDLLEDRQGRLWAATRGGLSCFDGAGWRSFTLADGLPSDCVLGLYEDRAGHFWLCTDGGVVRYDGRVFQTVRSPALGAVGQIVEDRQGVFWLATLKGLVRYAPGTQPPGLRMVQVVADRIYRGHEAVESPRSDRPVIFEFKGMSRRTHPRDMRYICRLQGHETHWRSVGGEGRVYYNNLPSGSYTFQVRAVDRDLNYSPTKVVELTVVPDPRLEGLNRVLSQSADEFVGQSSVLRQMQKQLAGAAVTDLTVLVLGETGSGKGMAARTLHVQSLRRQGPFIQVNCGALPGNLVESELFGHERGAFTGAHARRLGKVELAAGGTLFLDEIGDMALEAQVKLLRLLEEQTFERVGGTQTLTAEVRVVAATNRDLWQMVQDGAFREDFYFRLQALEIMVPPLRQRREDIDLLAVYFVRRAASHLHKAVTGLTVAALELLRAYAWPGNVRELEHMLQRAVILSGGAQIQADDLGLDSRALGGRESVDILPFDEYSRRYILQVLEHTNWVIKGPRGAAALLDMHEATLRSRMRKLAIRRPGGKN
ncbi:MAG: AAA domain-containing protein [Candidatus Latescibacteria bacterium]|nr:AAA domain-containing protein [Candidatus Latescibacterota bacterium]